MILCLPAGRVTFLCANVLILFLTTSIPLLSAILLGEDVPFIRSVKLKYTLLVRIPQ
jgi:hypothetical protein